MVFSSFPNLCLNKYRPNETTIMDIMFAAVILSCNNTDAKTIPNTEVEEYNKIERIAPINLNAIKKKNVESPVPKIPMIAIFGMCNGLIL